MNILFFLKPKSEVEYVFDDETLRQVLEKMEYHRYTAIPIISQRDGTYKGTITAGDLLWYIKDRCDLTMKKAEEISIMQVPRRRDNQPVDADANMEDLLALANNQNFVPVIDDSKIFIGIITRKDILTYLNKKAGN